MHIPPEVIEPAAKALFDRGAFSTLVACQLAARAAITAALEAWPATGMAKNGVGVKEGFDWCIDADSSPFNVVNNPLEEFPVLIIRTEAE